MGALSQLRRLRAVYASGTAAWAFCLLLSLVRGDGSTRQTVFLLLLLAAFLVLLLWSTWCLWEARTRRPVSRASGPAPSEGTA
ncbi:hypothetical protein [Streptomyces glaucus]|uniref:Secreted protein n=1 Tax=Streptomyces glaucus TaxID=284029 RepID=A0ABN3KIM5_9ACTN